MARAWLVAYALAFVLLLVAGGILVVAGRSFLSSFSVLWASIACSAAAIVVAAISVFLPRR